MGSTREKWKRKTRDHWLPDGWVLVHKKRKSGVRAGAQYKCFIEQSTGCKFYSKPEVIRYLKTAMCNSFFPESEQFSTVETTGKVTVEKQNAIHLSPGCIRETKVRRTAKGIRRYPPSPASGVLELNHPSSRRKASIGQKPSDLSDVDVSAVDQSNKERIFMVSAEINLVCMTTTKADCERQLPKNETGEFSHTEENSDSGTSASLMDVDSIEKLDKNVSSVTSLVTPEADKMEDPNRKTKSKSCTCKKTENSSVCSRYSRRLAGFEPERETANITSEMAHLVSIEKLSQDKTTRANLANEESSKLVAVQGIGRTSDTSVQAKEDLDYTIKEASVHQKDKLLRRTENCDNRRSRANKSKKKEDSLPCRSSKRLAGLEPELIVHSMSCKRALEYSSKKPRSDLTADLVSQQLEVGLQIGHADVNSVKISKLTNGESKAAFEKQEQNQEAEIMDGEKAKSHLSFSLGGSLSDPCLQIAIKTLTEELLVKDTANINPNLNFGRSKSKNSMHQKSSKKPNEMKTEKSKKKMEPNLPSRSSKRLVGHEPELMANLLYGERAPKYITRKSDNDSAESSQQLDVVNNIDPAPLSESKETTSDIQTSRLCEENYEAASVAAKEQQQLQKVEVEQPPISFSVRDSWSDPCIDFAIKTLTGALSVEDIPNAFPISTNPEADILQHRTCHQNLGARSVNERNHIHLLLNTFDTVEEEFMVFQPLKQQGHEREMRGCTMPSDSIQEQRIEESFREDVDGEGRSVHGSSKHLQASVETESIQEELPEQINMSTEWQVVPEVQLENFVTPKINTHELHMPLSSSFLESWSDPCLDFAIKTLTGAIPLEEPLPFPGHSLEMHTSAQSHATSVMPDFEFPGFFPADVSSYYVPDKFEAVKESFNTTLVPPIDVSSTLAMHHLIDVGRCSVESEPTWCMERIPTKKLYEGFIEAHAAKGSVEEGPRSKSMG